MLQSSMLTTVFLTSLIFTGVWAQLDNVALNKTAGTNGYNEAYPPSGAVDGYTSSRTCAIVFAPRGVPAEWWVDLEESYRVQRIRLYNTYGYFGNPARFNNFVLSVRGSLSDHTACGPMFHRDSPLPRGSSVDISCDQVGRFVHLRRVSGTDTPENIKHITLCEVQVYGKRQLRCTNCPEGTVCDGDVGCSQCAPGKLRPECIEDCEAGKYGIDCLESCGHCANSAPCQKDNGFCSLCETWWTDDRCKTEIKTPVVMDETVSVASITNNTATITWEPLQSVPQNLAGFYSYKAKYRQGSGSYMEGPFMNHSGSTFAYTFGGLTHNTDYEFAVNTYRVRGSESTAGDVYSPITRKTKCNSPDTPVVTVEAENGTEVELGPIIVTFMEFMSGCDNIQSLEVQYKYMDEATFTTEETSPTSNNFTIQPSRSGHYLIRIVIFNNQNLSAVSLKYNATVINTIPATTTTVPPTPPTVSVKQETPAPPGLNPAAVAVPVVLILLAVGISVGIFFWRRRISQREDDLHKVNGADLEKLRVGGTSEQGRDRNIYYDGMDNIGMDEPKYDTASLESMDDVQPATRKVANSVPKPKPQPRPRPETQDVSQLIQSPAQKPKPQRKEPSPPQEPVGDENIYATSAVPVDNFEAYVSRRKNNMKDFENEYKNMPEPDMSKCTVATSDDNMPRNRYKNIYAYDMGRVLLGASNPDETDYINANYITGFNRKKEYIATQGPRKNTLVEFWRMIWQEKTNRIVMVANKLENGKGKCSDYWSEEAGGSLRFDQFIVTTEAVEKCADYITSVLSLRKGETVLTIRHFHFTTWEDKSNPVYGIQSLLAFNKKVHSFDSLSRGPMVVHCSAGVGRTGTFIVLDILMQQATVDRSIDVSSCVQRARRERMNMVQTLDQYYFLHDALVEFIRCGDTAITCVGFESSYQALCAKNGGVSSLEIQFQKLCKCREDNSQQTKDGSEAIHANKNRRPSVIPASTDRPFLPGKQEDSYINAVFIDSYKHHDFYIATQLPLPHTVVDFWRMVHSQESSAIVTLNPVAEQDRYWPTEDSPRQTYGAIEVTLSESERVSRALMSRTYNVSKKGKKQYVNVVKHLHLTSWPDDCEVPPQPSHLLELRDQVLKWQQQNELSKTTGDTIVQCLDGVRHCGLYLATVYVLEKMQQEQEADPFFAVRFALRKRPEFIQSLIQYQFLFKMVRENVTEHNEYANV